ncbi:MAG: hypothetical protein ACREJ2_18970 [Planctomycetota bacterium]
MRDHLQALRILHFVLAALDAVWLAGAVLETVAFTVMSAAGPAAAGPGGPGGLPGMLGAAIFGFAALVIGTVVVLNILAGVNIGRGTRWKLCLAAAIANLIPLLSCCYALGIPLGVYGLVVLLMPESKLIFQRVAAGAPYLETVRQVEREFRRPGRPRRNEPGAGGDEEMDVDGGWDEGRK